MVVGDVAHDAHEPDREPVPAADRAHLDLGPALGARRRQEAVLDARVGALAGQQRRERPRVQRAVGGVHELRRRAAERLLDGQPRGGRPVLAQVRPAALLVGLEDAVDHALDDAAVALLAAAQTALGVAEGGQVGVDDDGAEAAAVGVANRAAAGEQRERADGRVDAHLDVAHLFAAQRAQQRRLVRAQRLAVGVDRPKASAHSSGCRSSRPRCGGRRSDRIGRRRRAP